MNFTFNIDNNLECALFKFTGQPNGATVLNEDVVFAGKVKKLQKHLKKLPNGKYNLSVVNEKKTKQYGMLIQVKNKVANLAFE